MSCDTHEGSLRERSSPDYDGFFISFEGVETSGKTTQADLLTSWLKTCGYDIVQTREPGGSELGEAMRSILLDMQGAVDISARAETLLFAASRAQLVHQVIAPALRAGRVVVCDRFVDSSLAYQGFGLGMPLAAIWDVNRFAAAGLLPDLTFVLGRGGALEPSGERSVGDRIEARGTDFHGRVRQGYLSLARRFADRIVVIDTSGGVRRTARTIRSIVSERLKDRGITP